jgi:hypothetical protein
MKLKAENETTDGDLISPQRMKLKNEDETENRGHTVGAGVQYNTPEEDICTIQCSNSKHADTTNFF